MSRATDISIPIHYLHECFVFNPPSAVRWRVRPRPHFNSDREWRRWNTRFADHSAGGADGKGYLQIELMINGKRRGLRGHRVIWALIHNTWPADQIDHKNRNKTDDTPSNLREVTGRQNRHNTNLQRNNTSGVKGVSQHTDGGWQAQLTVNGRHVLNKHFTDFTLAVAARKAAEKIYQPFATGA